MAIARELLGMDAAYVAEFTDERQVYRALDGDADSFGMSLNEGPPAVGTYCQRMLNGELPNVIPDSGADERVRDLEITKQAEIGAYAAVPFRFPDGTEGSLCCVSHQPDTSLAERDITFMHALARLIEDHLERHEIERSIRETLGVELVSNAGELRSALARLDASQTETIFRLSQMVEYRDDDTGMHVQRVSRLSHDLAIRAGLDASTAEGILLASPLHDAGKVAIPDAVLLKPGKLTSEERAVIERHAEAGYELLRGSVSEALELAALIAWTHHERWDGGGYPRGLAGEQIPIEGRIVAIADVYDALRSARVYRPAFSAEDAAEMLREERGTHFDPDLLDVFLSDLAASADGYGSADGT